MIKCEINRVLKRKSFYVVLLVGITITALEALSNNNIRVSQEDFIFFPNGVYNNLMIYNVGKYMRMLQMVFPLIVTVAFADSYIEDVKSGFIKNITTRYDKKRYLIERFFVNFVVSGVVISIPLIVNYMLYAGSIPSLEPNVYFSQLNIDVYGFLPGLYYKFPFLHMVVRILLLFVYGGALSSIALAASIFTKSKYIITILPFIVYIGMDVLIPMFFDSGYRYSPMIFLFNPTGYNFMFIAIPSILITACFFIFLLGGMKNEFA